MANLYFWSVYDDHYEAVDMEATGGQSVWKMPWNEENLNKLWNETELLHQRAKLQAICT